MFRWGVLSTAKIGWEHLIPAIVTSDNGILAGLARRDLATAQAMAQRGDGVYGGASAALMRCCRWNRSSRSASSARWRWATSIGRG